MGFDSFGLPAENAAIREGGHPREITERNIAHIRAQMQRIGLGDRLDARGLDARARVLPLDAVAVPALPRARPRVPQGRAGQVVPERPDRARERAGDRRPLRALRRRGRGAEPGAVVLPDHGLRRRAARRPGRWSTGPSAIKTMQRNWIGRSEGAEIALPDRGAGRGRPGLHDAAGHAVRRDVLRARARAPARRRGWRASASRGARLRAPRGRARRPRSARAAKEKTGVFTGLPRGQPRQRRADPDLGRRLRPDGLRHGRDHGRARARRARLRVRASVRPPGPPGRAAADGEVDESGAYVAHTERRGARQLGRVRRPARARGRARDRRVARGARGAAGSRSTTACATGASRASATGAARSRSSTATRAASSRCPTSELPVAAARDRGLQAEGHAAARAGRGLGERAVPALRRGGAARDRHDGHVRRLVLVLPALLRPAQRRRRRSTARSSTTGCPSTSTSAASTTRPCT